MKKEIIKQELMNLFVFIVGIGSGVFLIIHLNLEKSILTAFMSLIIAVWLFQIKNSIKKLFSLKREKVK
jgi:hypothetical protein